MKKILKSLLVLFLALSLVACGNSNTGSIKSGKKFDAFVDSLPSTLISNNSVVINQLFAHKEKYGFKDELFEWGTFDVKDYKKELKKAEKIYNKLLEFDYDSLNENQQLTYDVLKDSFKDIDFDIDDESFYYLDNNPLGFYDGVLEAIPQNFIVLSLENKNDVDSYVHLIDTIDTFLDDCFSFEKKRQAKGYGMSEDEVNEVIGICDDMINANLTKFITDDFNGKIDQVTFIDDNEKTEYKNKVAELAATKFKDGFTTLKNNLQNLKVKTKNKTTLAKLKDGKEYYEYLVYLYTNMDIKEYKEYLDKMLDVSHYKLGFSGEVYDELYSLYMNYDGPEDLDQLVITNSNDPNTILDELKTKMSDDFPAAYDVSYSMSALPEELKTLFNGVGAFYLPSKLDEKDTNEIMIKVNDYKQTDFSMISHEGYPGHMYQQVYYKDVEHPFIRDILTYKGYSEGYANYVQRYSIKYADNVSQADYYEKTTNFTYFAILQMDYMLHYENDYEGALELYRYLFDSDEEYPDSLQQIIESPGSFICYYSSGFLFDELKADVKEALGKDYSDKKFHEAINKVGPSSFDVLKKWTYKYLDIKED